jgi:hypothetical protein
MSGRTVLAHATAVLVFGAALLAPPQAHAVNPGPPSVGLVGALDSVGESLFGRAIFGASLTTLNDGSGNLLPAVQIDLADASPLPSVFNVFSNPGPPDEPTCQTYFQVEVSASGVTLRADQGFDARLEITDLSGFPPEPCAGDLQR